jgi:predicted transcriptional regulator
MSKIKDLKSNPETIFNLIDVLELFSPGKKSKYTDTLLRLMKNTKNLKSHIDEIKAYFISNFNFITNEDMNKFSDIQILLMYRFVDSFFNSSDLQNFRKFCEYNERGLISQNDLTTYKSFDEVMNQLSLADLKVSSKDLENEIIKVYEDDEWLLVRPLTYLSSRKYGSNTKWCTTTESNPEYFMKYTKKGVLIYCINKKTGYKVASFYSLDKNDPEFSFWNQKDSRIDSLDSELTDDLRKIIQQASKDPKAKTNRFLLSDEQRIKEDKILNSNLYKSGSLRMVEEDVIAAPSEEGMVVMRNRIENAIRRENDMEPEEVMMVEREEERVYEDRDNTVSESPIDRMIWSSTSSDATTNYETE